MNRTPNITPTTRPAVNLDAHANLDIKLDGWSGATAVGFICAALVTAYGLFLKFRS